MKSSRSFLMLFLLFFVVLVASACGALMPTATPVPPTATATAVPPTATATTTVTNTASPTNTTAPTNTPRPTDTPTLRPTPTVAAEVVLTSTLDSGWTLYEMQASNFAVALPPKWKRLELNPGSLGTGLEMAGDLNPKFKGLFSSQTMRSMMASGLRFYALDLNPEALSGDFPTTANVLKLDIGIGLPLDYLVPSNLGQLKNLADPSIPVTHRRVTLSNVEAEEFKYAMKVTMVTGEPVLTMVTQYLVADGTSEYVVTLICPRELSDNYAPTFQKIGQSFRLPEKTTPTTPPAATATAQAVLAGPAAQVAPRTATATAIAAAASLKTSEGWNVVLTDKFDDNQNGWTTGDGKSVANGKYVWDMNNRVNIYRGLPEMTTQTDFAASIDTRLVSGSPDCGLGLTFRNSTDPGYMTDYVFYIHNDQRWGFDIIQSPDPGIAQYGSSDAIVPRALNRITVIAQGPRFTFFVNGKYVGQAKDGTLARGKIGAAVWILGPGACQVEFDNLEVRVP